MPPIRTTIIIEMPAIARALQIAGDGGAELHNPQRRIVL
jgi:hypothetical protein